MAITYDVRESIPHNGGYSFSGAGVTGGESKELKVQSIADAGEDLGLIRWSDVAQAPGVPVVGESIWTHEGKCIPWSVCTDTTFQRHDTNRSIWLGNVQYRLRDFKGIPTSYFYPVDVVAGNYDSLWELMWKETDEVKYQGTIVEDDGTESTGTFTLPTGNLYDAPFKEVFPEMHFRVHQLETGLSDSVIASRLHAINSTDFVNGDPKYFWMCTQVQTHRVKIPRPADATEDGWYAIYTLKRSSKQGGWIDRRALWDYYYLKTANDRTDRALFADIEGRTFHEGLITKTGEKKGDGINGVPDYQGFLTQQTDDFSWLQPQLNPWV